MLPLSQFFHIKNICLVDHQGAKRFLEDKIIFIYQSFAIQIVITN